MPDPTRDRVLALLLGFVACTGAAERPPEARVEAAASPGPVAAVCADGQSRAVTGGYRFELDGEPFEPNVRSPSGEYGPPREGDVISVRGEPMLLGPPGVHRYFTDPSQSWSLELAVDDGPRRPVLTRFSALERDSELRTLLPGLRGLRVDATAGLPSSLDFGGTLVELDLELGLARTPPAPKPLPPTLQALRLTVHGSADPAGDEAVLGDWLVMVADLPQLRQLELEVHQNPYRPAHERLAVDGAWLTGLPRLERLELRGQVDELPLRHPEQLAALKQLHALALAQVAPIDLAPFRELPELRALTVEGVRSVDLRPIASFSQLATLQVDSREIPALPPTLPASLRVLTLISPASSAEQLAALRAQAPDVRLGGDWNLRRTDELACATRVRVRPDCSCSRCPCFECPCPGCVCRPVGDATPIDVVDPAAIAALIPLLAVAPAEVEPSPGGSPSTVEFYRSDVRLASVELDLSGSQRRPLLRWSTGRREVSQPLSQSDRDLLCRWFVGQGAGRVCAMVR
ncbi:hypothetical protein [Nannocystis pusilla]|uniref:hypothetical protein n=1 Tax=Nannocystis pusilla TaxID=889268 RepID=UPI003DA22332